MNVLILGIIVLVLSVMFIVGLSLDSVDVQSLLLSVAIAIVGVCMITWYCVTQTHQNKLDDAGIKFNLVEDIEENK